MKATIVVRYEYTRIYPEYYYNYVLQATSPVKRARKSLQRVCATTKPDGAKETVMEILQ